MDDVKLTKAQAAALREVASGAVRYFCGPKSLRREYEEWYTSPGKFSKKTFEALYKDGLIAYTDKPNCAGGKQVGVHVTDKGKALL